MDKENIIKNLVTIINQEEMLNVSYSILNIFNNVNAFKFYSSMTQIYLFGKPVFTGCLS